MTHVTAAAGNLPVPFTSFVGRQEESAEVRRLLGAARLVTLTGAAGMGKTRLALEVAAASAKSFPGGAWLVDLALVPEPSAVADVVAGTLGVADVGTRPMAELLAAHLSERRVLLILDSCEHLVEACARLAQRLLSAAPELRILATGRETLQVTGEHVLVVAPLPEHDAAELLRQRTAAVRPGFEVTGANRADVARLCASLDGLPLAIELAASRLRSLSVEQVLERLEDRFALLTAGSRTARPHQRTLRAAIDWSWELCGREERLMWSRLSVFVEGFTLDAAEGVCAGEGVEPSEVLDLLDRLVAQSLVEYVRGAEPPRYRLLETIRRYGWERLTASGEAERVRRRHRDFFLALAERLYQGWFGPGQAETLTRLRTEHSDLLAALEYRGDIGGELPGAAGRGPTEGRPGERHFGEGRSGEPQTGEGQAQDGQSGAARAGDRQARLSLARSLLFHWIAGGFLGEGRRQLERALAEAAEPTVLRAQALVAAAYVAELQSDLVTMERWLQEAEELAERLGEWGVHATARGHRGVSALFQGRLEEALSCIEQAVAVHQALGDRFEEVAWRCALGIVQAVAEDPRAQETGRQALADAEALGERWARAHLLMVLGRRAWAQGDQEEAKKLTLSALETLRGFTDSVAVAMMVEQLAWITASDGDHHRAGRLLGAAHCLRQDTGLTLSAGTPQNESHHARCKAAVLRTLGPTGYDKALKEGATLDGPDQAIAYGLGPDNAPDSRVGRADPQGVAGGLTRREQQVAALVARGMTNRRIASELVLSPRTVDGHVDRVLTKLGFSRRAQIAAWWAENHTPEV